MLLTVFLCQKSFDKIRDDTSYFFIIFCIFLSYFKLFYHILSYLIIIRRTKITSGYQVSTDFAIEKWYNSCIKKDYGQKSYNADKNK